DIRNGVTPLRLSRAQVDPWSRSSTASRSWGGMAQKAKASGKARGYADVSPVVWMVDGPRGVHTACTRSPLRCMHGQTSHGGESNGRSSSSKSASTEPVVVAIGPHVV